MSLAGRPTWLWGVGRMALTDNDTDTVDIGNPPTDYPANNRQGSFVFGVSGTINCMKWNFIKGKLELLAWLVGIMPLVLLVLFAILEMVYAFRSIPGSV